MTQPSAAAPAGDGPHTAPAGPDSGEWADSDALADRAERPDRSEQDDADLAAEIEMFSAERMIFFTDAVAAIAITLLAFNLPLPSGRSNLDVLHSALSHGGDYAVFLISFAVIGNYWRAHHRAFRYVARISSRVASVNMVWLLLVVVVPFAARVQGNGSDRSLPVRVGFYAAVQVLLAVTSWWLFQLLRRDELLRAAVPDAASRGIRLLAVAAVFAVSIPVAFVNVIAAYALWVLSPVFVGFAYRLRNRWAGAHAPG